MKAKNDEELDLYIEHLIEKREDDSVDKTTAQYKYNHSHKRKLADARYLATEKGKENRRRSNKKYAETHPDRCRAKSRLYYLRHADEIKLRRIKKQMEMEDRK